MSEETPAGANQNAGGGGAPTGSAGGDLSGTYPNPTVAKLNGVAAASYALLAGPTFTGTVTLPTGTVGTTQTAADNSTKIATTAYADAIAALKANLASPTFTGTPTLPTGTIATTQSASDSSTKVATTAYVQSQHNLTQGFVSMFTGTGAQTVRTGTVRLRFPAFSVTILGISLAINTAPTGANFIIDVNKNGTTIFTTQGNRPTITASANSAAEGTAPDVTSFASGDYMTIDVDQVGSTIAGSDLTVMVRWQWA